MWSWNHGDFVGAAVEAGGQAHVGDRWPGASPRRGRRTRCSITIGRNISCFHSGCAERRFGQHRLDVIAAREVAVAQLLAAARAALRRRRRSCAHVARVVARRRSAVDHRAQPVLALARIADADRRDLLLELVDQRVGDAVVARRAATAPSTSARPCRRPSARCRRRRGPGRRCAVTMQAFLPPISAMHGRG